MPVLDTIIPEVTKQVIEPVSDQIVRRLLSVLGVWGMFKDNYHLKSDNLRSGDLHTQTDPRRVSNNRCDVQITPNYNPLEPVFEGQKGQDAEANRTSRRWLAGPAGEFPIFNDNRANIYLHEVDVPCSVELEFTLRSKSIELADIISTALYSKALTGGSVYDYNDVVYHYALPDRVLLLLHHLHQLQDSILDEVSFPDYLKVGSNSAIIPMKNRHQLEEGIRQLVIQRSAVQVLGKVEYDGDKPEAEHVNKVADRYDVQFRYIYQIGRPALMRVSYPIMIDNQLISKKFVRRPHGMSRDDVDKVHPNQAINEYFRQANELSIDLYRSYPLVQYPDYDDFTPHSKIYPDFTNKYQPIFIGLMSLNVDETDGTLSLTLDLKNEVFPMISNDAAVEIEKLAGMDYSKLTTSHDRNDLLKRTSIFNISIFAGDNVIDFERVHLTDELVLSAQANFDISKPYRVVISQVKDIRVLSQFYVHYMLENPDYYLDFLARHLTYLLETNYVKIVRDEITQGLTMLRQRKNLQVYKSHSGPYPTLRLGRYVVEPR